MSPYFARDCIHLYHGDCREVLPALSIQADMVLADPPYGETSLAWDKRVKGWLAALRPVLKREASLWCFGSLRSFMATAPVFSEHGWRLAQEIVWEKHNGSSFHADRFKRVHELLAHFYPAMVPWFEIYKSPVFTRDATKRTVRRKERPPHTGEIAASTFRAHDGGPRHMRSVLQVRSCHGRALHPTEKPVGILSPAIEFSCPPAGLLVVPFAGVGSELEAAKIAGRRAIGVELNEAYCELAAKRLEQGVFTFGEAPQ